MAELGSNGNGKDALADALRRARLAEAAHVDAVLNIRDSKTLRLQLLKDDLLPIVSSNPEASKLFDLALVPGDPPRLWLDMIAQVVMEPDHRTYRLVQDTRLGRETLFETADRAEMMEHAKTHLAHRLIAREREIAVATPARESIAGYSGAALIFAWTTGFAVGALALMMAAILLEKIKI
ncbi:MAG: hypothetical protein HC855_06900 [Rhizobiales bacterium]|nr:hypothetical protein [Hyphomicrobiales bacterium]